MEMLDEYFALQKKIYDYFGYVEDWKAIPLDDNTGRYWGLIQRQDGSGTVFYLEPGTEPSLEVIVAGEQIYSGLIYTQRFLPKWVYEGKDHTMISVDTQTDGNKFLMVFDNDKRITDQTLLDAYENHWG